MREINIEVVDQFVTAGSNFAGVCGESGATKVRIIFDESWDGLSKTVTWWNAAGKNPVERVLTSDLLEDITSDLRRYITTVPGEALEYPGLCSLVIEGYKTGVRARSVAVRLEVADAPVAYAAGQPESVTPTQAEQLQSQIEDIMADIQKAAQAAGDAQRALEAKERAEAARDEADSAKLSAQSARDEAVSADQTARTAAQEAQQASNEARASMEDAQRAQQAALASSQTAQEAGERAGQARDEAVAAAEGIDQCLADARTAKAAAQSAQAQAQAAQMGAASARDETIGVRDEFLNKIDEAVMLKGVKAEMPSAAYWSGIAYGNGRLVAVNESVGASAGAGRGAYSDDEGRHWHETDIPGVLRSVAFGAGASSHRHTSARPIIPRTASAGRRPRGLTCIR